MGPLGSHHGDRHRFSQLQHERIYLKRDKDRPCKCNSVGPGRFADTSRGAQARTYSTVPVILYLYNVVLWEEGLSIPPTLCSHDGKPEKSKRANQETVKDKDRPPQSWLPLDRPQVPNRPASHGPHQPPGHPLFQPMQGSPSKRPNQDRYHQTSNRRQRDPESPPRSNRSAGPWSIKRRACYFGCVQRMALRARD